MKQFFFVKTEDGRYLQSQWDPAEKVMAFWLEAHTMRAWTGCHETPESAKAYIEAARGSVFEALVIVQEAL